MAGRTKKSKLLWVILTIIVITILAGTAIYAFAYYNQSIYEPIAGSGQPKQIDVTIESSAATQIPDILYNAGLLRDKTTFKIYLRLNKLDSKLKAGKYEFNTGMNAADIINKIVKGDVKKDTIKITIPEGFTVKEIAEAVEKTGLTSKEKFLSAVQDGNFDYEFLKNLPKRSGKLEGYLFPDTYEFAKSATPEQIIKKMIDRFNEIFNADMQRLAATRKMSIDQIVTMASIIEKEARVESERPIISGVYYNRLKIKQPLQVDATVLYALGGWKEKVYYTDLEIDSPYNTYKHQGLPIGPISNPGKASLNAALNPDNVDYFYYVAKGDGSGAHSFTVTYSEFLKEVQKSRANQK